MRCLLGALVLLLAVPAHAVEGDSVVSSVVVFPDRARVTRSATVQVGAGPQEVVIRGLPANLDVDSLRAKGSGTSKVILGALDARRAFTQESSNEAVRKIEGQIEGLRDADRVLADQHNAAQWELDHLKAIRAKSAAQSSERILDTPEDQADQLGSLLDALGQRGAGAQAVQREVAVKRRGITRQIDALQRELNQLRGGQGKQELAVAVAVEVKKAGRLTLQLTYSARGASWSPTYDVRALPDQGVVEVTYGAWVQQGTGEDWSDVTLTLSTARPSLGTSPPNLPPWVLAQRPPPAPTMKRRSSRNAPGIYAESAMDADDGAMAPMAEEELYEAEQQVAQVDDGGASVEFGVPGTVRVPGDRTRKRVTIASWRNTGAKLRYVVVPELSPSAFLSAELTHNQTFPLLPGELQAFLEDAYVGKGSLRAVAAGETYEVAFGADERIKVERNLLAKDEGNKGLFSGKAKLAWSWQTTVESFQKRGVTVIVRGREPVSDYDKVVVTRGKDTTAPTREPGRGVLEWELTLAPGAKQVLRHDYEITFPPDERPWGL